MGWLKDDRTECWSVMTEMPVAQYLEFIRVAHATRGGIDGQRDVLKTTTAKRIRERMVADIRRGAVLPPVVLGSIVDKTTFDSFPLSDAQTTPDDLAPKDGQGSVAIIDGMQRTAALLQAIEGDASVGDRSVRVEFWLTLSVRAMIYRMLVLNTGQVPWTLARQLSVVFDPLISEITTNVPELDKVIGHDKAGRRIGPAQYGGDTLVEIYLAFSLRKTNLDTKEALSEEFSRIDFVDNLSRAGFQNQFYDSLTLLAKLDRAFSRYDPKTGSPDRYVRGRNIFDSQPARIGLMVAIAQQVLGRPGMDRPEEEAAARMAAMTQQADELICQLDGKEPDEVGEFLSLDVLRQRLQVRTGQVGRFERAFFFEAFKVLIGEQFSVPNMEPCWLAN